jgi:hypothetical protein
MRNALAPYVPSRKKTTAQIEVEPASIVDDEAAMSGQIN